MCTPRMFLCTWENIFWPAKKAAAPSTLQELLQQFSPSRRKEYFITVPSSWEKPAVKKRGRQKLLYARACLSRALELQPGWVRCRAGSPWGEERPAGPREGDRGQGAAPARPAGGEGNGPERQNTGKPRTALWTRGTGNVIVTGV